jgi:hypothetical protein
MVWNGVEIRIEPDEIPEGSVIYVDGVRWQPEPEEQRSEMLETIALVIHDYPMSQRDVLEFVQADNKRYPTRLPEADLKYIAKAAYAFKELKPMKGKIA